MFLERKNYKFVCILHIFPITSILKKMQLKDEILKVYLTNRMWSSYNGTVFSASLIFGFYILVIVIKSSVEIKQNKIIPEYTSFKIITRTQLHVMSYEECIICQHKYTHMNKKLTKRLQKKNEI